MPEFGYKTALGIFRKVNGGEKDSTWTFAEYTRDEFFDDQKERKTVERRARNAEAEVEKLRQQMEQCISAEVQKQAEAAREKARRQANVWVQDQIDEAVEAKENRIRELEQKLGDVQKDNKDYKALNENLLRISRERANADRKIKPKKGNTGYVVLRSEEREITYKKSNGDLELAILWETTLQTPFAANLSETQLRELVAEVFSPGGEVQHPLSNIGLEGWTEEKYKKAIANWKLKKEDDKKNIVVRIRHRADFKKGYWEIMLLHTKPLRMDEITQNGEITYLVEKCNDENCENSDEVTDATADF